MDKNHQPANMPSSAALELPHGPNHPQRPKLWRYFLIGTGLLQVVGVALFLSLLWYAHQQAQAGLAGSEFIGLAAFMTVAPIVGMVALINLAGLISYRVKFKPRGKGLVLGAFSFALSLILALYGAYSLYQTYIVSPRYDREWQAQVEYETEAENREFAAANLNPEISKTTAIELLRGCQLRGFYYTDQAGPEVLHGITFPSAEASDTGIVLVNIDGKPHRIKIADRHIAELVPIAREAQKTCPDLQFWHDGIYEQRQDGQWYFRGEAVN